MGRSTANNPMDSWNDGASAMHDEEDAAWVHSAGNGLHNEPEDTEEMLGRELASFAFLREEGDREVRLSFRDAPADQVAMAFRRAGALFISVTGERARAMQPPPITALDANDPFATEEVPPLSRRRRKRRPDSALYDDPSRPLGELTLRYFYATESTVYTVTITTSTGIIESIGNVYPSAQLSERELQARLAAIFR